jgi:prolipoprotein diacylglyceryltransferase
MSVSMPASRLLARLIEKKPNTATVSGGFFAGIVFAPAAVWLGNYLTGPNLPLATFAPVYAAMAIAYAFGEGTGRLGCLSFGCCYGRPLSANPRSLDRFIRPLGMVFTGKTKKISYASGWEDRPVWPVQAATSVIYTAAGLLATWAFLSGSYRFAVVMTISITQIWRVVSELFRGDYRGEGKLSVYQIFSLLSVLIVFLAGRFLPSSGEEADLLRGFHALWNLPLILFLEGWTVFVFWHSGRSSVTGSSLSFHVKKETV